MKRILHYTVAVEVDDDGECDPNDIEGNIEFGINKLRDEAAFLSEDDDSTTVKSVTVLFSHSEDEHGDPTPEIHRVLTCSALHLEEETCLSMLMDIPIGPTYSDMPYGQLIRVPLPQEEDPEEPESNWAPDVRALLARARSERCRYIRVDVDGSLLPDLPVYERART